MAIFQRGTHFAGHIIERHIGSGRVADVYEVVAQDGARRALKVHREAAPLTDRSQRSIGQEGDAIATIEHVNCVRFYDVGMDSERVWILIELVDGPDLLQLVRAAGGTLPIERAVSIVRLACEGVAAAHAHGILHRDLRPENILVDAKDLAKVADFGSTKLKGWGVATTYEQDPRSALYLAPEQIKTGVAGPWSDVYAMGIVLYEIVAGASPLGGPASVAEICLRQLEDVPPPLSAIVPGVPSELSELLQRALAKSPADRPTMRAFADVLAVVLRRLHAQRRAAARSLPLPNRDAALALTVPAMPAFRSSGGTMPMPAVPGPPAVIHDPDVGPWPGVSPPPQAATIGPVPTSPAGPPSSGREAVLPPPSSGVRVRVAAAPPPPPAQPPQPPARPVTMGETPKPPARPVTMGETPKPPARPVPATLVMEEVASPPERRSSGAPVTMGAGSRVPAPGAGREPLGPALAVAGGLLLLGLGAAGWLITGYGGSAPASAPPPPPPAASASASPAGSASGAAPVHTGVRRGGAGRRRPRDTEGE